MGVDVVSFDEEGKEVLNKAGELVCRKPLPCMPTSFLNDPENEKYIKSYFSGFENVWNHGDYIEFDGDGHSIIYGRSDATLNPGPLNPAKPALTGWLFLFAIRKS